MNGITISIIIPVYNSSVSVDRLVRKLINQTDDRVEIVLIDDGSTDDSLLICKKLQEKNRYIKLISQSNSGVSVARNAGLNIARGAYIFFLDSDDDVADNFVQVLSDLCDLNYDLVQMDWYSGTRDGYSLCEFGESEGNIGRENYIKSVIGQKTNQPWNKLYKAEVIKKNGIRFDISLPVCEDVCFTVDFLKYAESIYVSKQALYYYTENSGGLCGKVNPRYFYFNYTMYQRMEELLELYGLSGREDFETKLYHGMIGMAFRTVGMCRNKRINKEEIKEGLEKSGIYSLVSGYKYTAFQDKIRLFLLKRKLYCVIGWMVRKRG